MNLDKSYRIRLTLCNLYGTEVKVLADGEYSSGTNIIDFSSVDIPSGVYYCKLTGQGMNVLRKMEVIK